MPSEFFSLSIIYVILRKGTIRLTIINWRPVSNFNFISLVFAKKYERSEMLLDFKLTRHFTIVSWMLAEDMRIMGQKQRSLLLTAVTVAKVWAFSCTGLQAPIPMGLYEEGQVIPAHAWIASQKRSSEVREPKFHILDIAEVWLSIVLEWNTVSYLPNLNVTLPLLQRKTLFQFSKNVNYTNILEKIYRKRQSVSLLIRYADMWEIHGELPLNRSL